MYVSLCLSHAKVDILVELAMVTNRTYTLCPQSGGRLGNYNIYEKYRYL